MAIKEIFESVTDKIDLATELLSELSDREGQYVWKKLTAQNGTFVDYVTADSADAYPNGGMQDGYWYELVKEGIPYTGANPLTIGESGATIPANTLLETALQIVSGVQAGVDLSVFGCTKYAVDKFTPSSNIAAGGTVSHSLGQEPRIAIVTSNRSKVTNARSLTEAALLWGSNIGDQYAISLYWNGSFIASRDSYMGWATSTYVRFIESSDTNYTWQKGVEYTVFTAV